MASPEPVLEPPPAIAVLLTSDLLPLVLRWVPAKEQRRTREWCKSARQACDAECPILAMRDVAQLGLIVATLPSSVRGILGRGCRPQRVTLDLRNGPLDDRLACGRDLLGAFRDLGAGQPYLKCTALALNVSILSPDFARTVASVFPALEKLHLMAPSDHNNMDRLAVSEGLSCLLRGVDAAAGDDAAEQGFAAGAVGAAGGGASRSRWSTAAGEEGGGVALLPGLASVRLSFGPPDSTSVAITQAAIAAMRGRAGLRELTVDPVCLVHRSEHVVTDVDLVALHCLTQLRALGLQLDRRSLCGLLASVPRLPLTSLTRLSLDCAELPDGQEASVLALAALTRLTGLQELSVRSTPANISSLGALRSLTGLTVLTFVPPLTSPNVADGTDWRCSPLGTSSIAAWPLPPLLRSLGLRKSSVPLEMLAALKPPARLLAFPDGAPALRMVCGRHTTRDGVLLPAGEAVLLAAIRLLAGSCCVEVSYEGGGQEASSSSSCSSQELEADGVSGYVGPALLRPAAGAAAGGGGCGGHSAWLLALGGSMALRTLKLSGVRLSVRDFESIVRELPNLEELLLLNPSCAPVHKLALLTAGLPRLKRLLVGADHWERSMAPASVEARAALSAVLAARADLRFGEQRILSVEGYKSWIFLDKALEALGSKVRYQDLIA